MTRLYIDMDGVIADFDRHYEDSFGSNPWTPRQHTKKEVWAYIKNHEGDFFTEIPLMPGAKELIRLAHRMRYNSDLIDVQILTSVGNSMANEVRRQKHKWLIQHGVPFQPLYTREGPDKAWFAAPGDILIDDMEANIKAWQEAGGIGILCKSTEQAIDDLLEAVYANPRT